MNTNENKSKNEKFTTANYNSSSKMKELEESQ
jgi:hypothetical protein